MAAVVVAVVDSSGAAASSETPNRAEAAKPRVPGAARARVVPFRTVAYATPASSWPTPEARDSSPSRPSGRGPTGVGRQRRPTWQEPRFSPDGRWLVTGRRRVSARASLRTSSTRRSTRVPGNPSAGRQISRRRVNGSPDTGHSSCRTGREPAQELRTVVLWSADGKSNLSASFSYGVPRSIWEDAVSPERGGADSRASRTTDFSVDALGLRRHPRAPRHAGISTSARRPEAGPRPVSIHEPGRWFGVISGKRGLCRRDRRQRSVGAPRLLGRHDWAGQSRLIACDPLGRFFATAGEDGEIRLWEPTGWSPPECSRAHRESWIWDWITRKTGPCSRRLSTETKPTRI